MKLRIVAVLSTILMISINILSNIIPFNNQSTAQISDSYKVLFVPAGYVFSIWGVIYLGLIAFSIYILSNSGKSNKKIDSILIPVIISNIANSIWIFLWHYNHPLWCVPVILVMLVSLCYISIKIKLDDKLSAKELNMVKIPFSIYTGWLCVATVANISVALYVLKWDAFGLSMELWTALTISFAAVLAFIGLLKNKDIYFATVFVWAFVGIAIKFNYIQSVNIVSCLCALAISLVVIYTVLSKILKTKNV